MELSNETAHSFIRLIGDILQLKDDQEFMSKLLYNSNQEDLDRLIELRDRIASKLNEELDRAITRISESAR